MPLCTIFAALFMYVSFGEEKKDKFTVNVAVHGRVKNKASHPTTISSQN